MNTALPRRWFGRWALGGIVVSFLSFTEAPFAQTTQPVITSIHPDGTNVVVTATVPAGIARVTLESRARFGSGAWAPTAVAQTSGTTATVVFRIPLGRGSEMLRVRADAEQRLPARFYSGTNSFAGEVTSGTAPPGFDGVVTVNGNPGSSGLDPSRAVVESDIWKISGDTLYFFNQYRGLQVLDITRPDQAALTGTMSLPAAGEQMYVPCSNRVVLLAHGGCYSDSASKVLTVAVSNGVPRLWKTLPLPGDVIESRMVGTALYVASQCYRQPAQANGVWEWGTLLSAFDLANPDSPVERGSLWYPGYGNVVTATDTYLFVATQHPTNWWQSVVRLVDITQPDGTMAAYASLQTRGQVPDKFKLNYVDNVLTLISEDWHVNTTNVVTRLETFRLLDPRTAGPESIAKLGELELGNGQRLHATRFDGDRVYIVTFFRVDPLWIVDLSDPAQPHVAGSLEVPGWSSYLQPLGPRLVSVGVETNRVAVSLFDVASVTNPRLLSRVLLGQSYSWSEANNDEKAFTVLTDIGLILVPYSGNTTNGWTSEVQLIDLKQNTLEARGVIHHECQPRRATWSHDRILSISGWELLSVDASDRSAPQVRGQTALAWPVDRLVLHGDFVVEIEASTTWWGRPDESVMRVATVQQPDLVLNQLPLGTNAVVGAVIRNERLYLAQSQSLYCPLPLDDVNGLSDTNPPNFCLTVMDVSKLPDVKVLGQVWVAADLPAWSGGVWEAVWPQPDVVVWAGGGFRYWWAPWLGVITAGPSTTGGFVSYPVAGFGGGQLLAFDVSKSTDPKFVSELNLATNSWWSFSEPFSVGSLVYLSHTAAECLSTNPPAWVRRAYLDVIDYADAASPTPRKPVNIPGTLQGISHDGEVLYTTGYHWTPDNLTDWKDWLDVCAYDGVSAHLVNSLALPETWPHPVLVADTNIFIGRPGSSSITNLTPNRLEAWTLADAGNFRLFGSTVLKQPANRLLQQNGLLATQEGDGFVALFNAFSTPVLVPLGGNFPTGCAWYDLSQAEGNLEQGLWIPLGMYGVGHVPVGP